MSLQRVYHVLLLLAWGDKDRKWERKLYSSCANLGFLFFLFCYCLESTASVHGSLTCVSLVPFQKGGNKYGIFFHSENSKITKISPFSVGETSIALGTDSSTSAMCAKAKHTEQHTRAVKTRITRNATEPLHCTVVGRPGSQ